MKKSFLTFLILFTCAFTFAQEVIYTVSGELNSVKTPLDSIVVENLTTGKHTRFANLPVKDYYQINLTKNAYWGTVGIDNLKLPMFGEVHNLPGLLAVSFGGSAPEKVKVTVYNTIGQMVYSGTSKTVFPGNTVEIRLANEGLYFVVIETPRESKTIKALGSLAVTDFCEVVSERAPVASKLKSGGATIASQSNFMIGDSVRVSVYKSGYYARPQGAKIVNSIPMNFPFQISTVALTGTSDGYVELHPMTTDITAYDTINGKVQIKYSGESPNLLPGNVITVDMDTMGYLRKVVSTTVNGNIITAQTVPAYMNEIFVDKEIKLNTGLMNPGVQLKSTASMEEISKALTDKDGYIHPVAVYYHTGNGQVVTKSAFTTPQNEAATVPLFDFTRDLKKDLYGKSGDNAHLYISDGNASLTANAVFEMGFDREKELDADTKIRKGDLRYFKFYLEGTAGFQTKLALDLSKSFEKEDEKKLSEVGKVTTKFVVGAVPVWITFGADIYGKYNVTADASLHANWGFESTHTVQVGGTYTKATDSFIPFKSYTPLNKVYPLNLDGQVNASARFEVYPRTEVKFYGFFGPYMEIVPYVEGKYNARLQSQINSTGAESFLAWNSGVDLGLDFRVGTELTFLWGLFDKEFGPTVINGPVWPLWKSPSNITLLSLLPAEAAGGTVVTLNFKVTDMLENPVILCPIYIKGDGTFSKQVITTNTSGEATLNWTVGTTAGDNSFTATLYNADKSVNKELTKTVKVGLVPVADFTVSKTSINVGETIQFTDKSANTPTSWLWNFGDGSTSTAQNSNHSYITAGTYTVSLKVGNRFGENTKSTSNYINVEIPVDLPTVSTSGVSYLSQSSASSGGNVTSDGGGIVTARGVCWNTTGNPTVAENHSTDGSGNGIFTSIVTGLTTGVTYYIRAYATNSKGTAYGSQMPFSIQLQVALPVVSTNSVTSITQTTATAGGNITSDGGAAVTARGVCWSTSQNPTIANSKATNGSGIGGFSSNLTGLTANTTYYIRTYATNSQGTAYGDQISFKTLDVSNPSDAFITKWDMPAGNFTLSLFNDGSTYNFTIDYGDGTKSQITDFNDPDKTHYYANAGIYQITITGLLPKINFNSPNLLEVINWGNVGFTTFLHTFNGCINLKKLPDGPITGATSVKDFYYTFSHCSSLTSLPAQLFSGCPNVTTFESCFDYCLNLKSIPEELFSNNPNVIDFLSCFQGCTQLTDIPERLFYYNAKAENMWGCFLGCRNLKSIPEKLFVNNSNIIDIGFCFYECSMLTTIPSKLFDSNNKVTSFMSCFKKCTGIISIPEGLFKENTPVIDFGSCFWGCDKLTSIPISLFSTNLKVTNFQACFQNCSNLNCEVPELWSRNNPSPDGSYCFYNCTKISNYSSIPYTWK